MKRLTTVFLLLLLLSAMATSVSALDLPGNFTGDYRLRFNEEKEISQAGLGLTLQPEARLGPAKFSGEFRLALPGWPAVQTASGLTAYPQILPWELEAREAYLEIYDFPIDRMDFRAGRQLIPWGVGDRVSPNDNLNPQDLAEISDFGRRLGTDGFQLVWYPGDLTVTAVLVPVFIPARLPAGWQELFLPPELAGLRAEEIRVTLPDASWREAAFGLKVAGRLGGYDLSLSYLDGRYDLPVPKEIRGELIVPGNPQSWQAKGATLFFPRRRVLGAAFSGEVGSAGLWAEAAVFFPDKVTTLTKIEQESPMPVQTRETVVLSDPYTKYLVGTDYTFPDGTYINLQFVHGFPHELGAEKLEDYFLFALEKTVLNGRVKITPLAGLLTVQDWAAVRKNYALVLAPEVSWFPADGTEFTLGVNWIEAAGNSLFNRFRQNDELYLKFKYSF